MQSILWYGEDQEGHFEHLGLVLAADDKHVDLFTKYGVMHLEFDSDFRQTTEEQDAEIKGLYERWLADEVINVSTPSTDDQLVVKMKRGQKKEMCRSILMEIYHSKPRMVVIEIIMDKCKIDKPLATSYYNHHSQCLINEGLL